MPLPTEITAVIGRIIKERPASDAVDVVSEVIETLGGHDPNTVVAWMKSCGGPKEFVQAILAETKQLKSERQKRGGK